LGSPFQAGGSIGNTAFIANAGTNLNTSALALEASQLTGNISLASIDAKLNSLGQKISSLSTPVVIASDQTAIPITGSITATSAATATAAPPLYTEAASSALSQDLSGQARVRDAALIAHMCNQQQELLIAILRELRVLTHGTYVGLNVRDQIEAIRRDVDIDFTNLGISS
jgi:hypothetical protein